MQGGAQSDGGDGCGARNYGDFKTDNVQYDASSARVAPSTSTSPPSLAPPRMTLPLRRCFDWAPRASIWHTACVVAKSAGVAGAEEVHGWTLITLTSGECLLAAPAQPPLCAAARRHAAGLGGVPENGAPGPPGRRMLRQDAAPSPPPPLQFAQIPKGLRRGDERRCLLAYHAEVSRLEPCHGKSASTRRGYTRYEVYCKLWPHAGAYCRPWGAIGARRAATLRLPRRFQPKRWHALLQHVGLRQRLQLAMLVQVQTLNPQCARPLCRNPLSLTRR